MLICRQIKQDVGFYSIYWGGEVENGPISNAAAVAKRAAQKNAVASTDRDPVRPLGATGFAKRSPQKDNDLPDDLSSDSLSASGFSSIHWNEDAYGPRSDALDATRIAKRAVASSNNGLPRGSALDATRIAKGAVAGAQDNQIPPAYPPYARHFEAGSDTPVSK